MPIEPGQHKSSYTNGEAKALIGPLVNCQPEDIGEFIIIARDKSKRHLGVFHTMYCQIESHAHCKALDLVAQFITDTAARMYELQPQHGPGEG